MAVLVENADGALGRLISLTGGLEEPVQCFSIVLRHTVAASVEKADVALRRRVALVGGFKISVHVFFRRALWKATEMSSHSMNLSLVTGSV